MSVYITKNKVILHVHTHARTIRKELAVWNRTSAGCANGDDYVRYSLCYNVILYLLNKISN